MIINPKESAPSKPKQLPDVEKLHGARIYGVVDLGTQEGDWKGKPKFNRKLKISFELDEYMEDGRPFSVHTTETVPAEMFGIEKSNLFKMLKAMTGQDPKFPIDAKSLIGMECALTLIKKISQTGKPYPKIENILSAKKMSKTGPDKNQNKPLFFSLDEFDQAVFDSLPDFIREDIAKSPEYANRNAVKTDDSIPF